MPVRYTIVQNRYILDRLAFLYVQAAPADRASISQASDQIDLELAEDADQKGDSLAHISPKLRRLTCPPLRVYFEVSEQDRLVRIRDYEIV